MKTYSYAYSITGDLPEFLGLTVARAKEVREHSVFLCSRRKRMFVFSECKIYLDWSVSDWWIQWTLQSNDAKLLEGDIYVISQDALRDLGFI